MRTAFLSAVVATLANPLFSGDLQKISEPTETQGVRLSILQQNALEAQIPAMKGYEIRARRIEFASGASFAKHNHAERPGFVFVESGEIIEGRNGTNRVFKAGDTWIEDAKTDHWIRNIGDEPGVIIMVDLPVME